MQEWIILFLLADGGGRSMAGIYGGVVGKCKEFILHGLNELAVVAAGEIGTPHRAGEESVAGDHELSVRVL